MRKSGIAAAALAVFLVGCGNETGDDGAEPSPSPQASSGSPTPTVQPARGHTIHAQGFSVTLPRGWADITPDAPEGVVLSGADVGADENPAALVVEHVESGPHALDAAESAGVSALEDDGAERVRLLEPTMVDGHDTAHVRGVKNSRGVHLTLDRFTLVSDSGSWVITFSTNRWQVEDDRQRLIDSVLATVTVGS